MDLTIDRKTQPDSRPIRSIDLMEPENLKLTNGFQVHLLNLGTQDLVKIELVCEAGLAYQSKTLISSFTNKMLAEGTKSFSAYEIAETFDRYGAYYSSNIDKDFASVALYCLTKYLDQVLPVFAEIICEPLFPENELQVLANKSKQEFIINLKKVKSLAQLYFPPLIFGNRHPYGQMTDVDDFNKVTHDDLRTFYQNFYLKSDSKLFISGKLDKKIIKKLNHTFSQFNIKLNANAIMPDFSFNANTEKYKQIKVKDALQSAIWVGKKLFNKFHPDFIGMQVLNTALGGYFGSRLMTNIREDKGFTYGIGSSIVSQKYDGYLAIQTEVGTKHTEATLTEIYKEIKILQTKLIGTEELELIKNFITGQLIRSMDGPFAVHEKLKAVILYNFDMQYYQRYIDEVSTISPETLNRLANEHLQKSSLAELIVGK
ncbi:MAG: insulinase family protein [Bacteroidetes bacterium HGW-Bacteroidetes-17]|nr:MAG: insulinase family protein [Bacteroidetes bacterium HGW-Bacteroidetes-17]